MKQKLLPNPARTKTPDQVQVSVIGTILALIKPMKLECPLNSCKSSQIIRRGHYRRTSDSKWIRRYSCSSCGKFFSSAIFSKAYGQKKRRLNPTIYKMLCSGVSQRRIARNLGCNVKTVARKLLYLNSILDFKKQITHNDILEIQFDEMETWVHSKLKPVSILVVVEKGSRKILEVKVRQMPAKGLIRDKSIKKYGKFKDERPKMFKEAFHALREKLNSTVSIESDESPRYPKWIKEYFPDSEYKRYKGLRGCVVGQGELKGGGKDPLFSLNHTCAMFRANINRLFRRTWCTTKDVKCLQMHLNLYSHYHNNVLT